MRTLILGIALLVSWSATKAQDPQTINSDGVSVRNSAPDNVFFMFPVGPNSNIFSIQLGCSDSPVNHNWLFVYEETSTGIVTYPFHIDPISCNETSNSDGTTFAATLLERLTVNTPDHTITIEAGSWTAVRASGRSGYYWKTSGGSATLGVN